MRDFCIKEQARLQALVPQEQYARYQEKLKLLSDQLDQKIFHPVVEPIMLLQDFALYDQDAPYCKDIPMGKVGTIQTAGILPVIAMDLISAYGNPLKTSLAELAEIAHHFQYRAYMKNSDGTYKFASDGSLIGNGVRWTFNDNVLPFFGVSTQMVGSFDEIVKNLKRGHPSIALLKGEKREEVIIRGVDSEYFHVIHGNKRKNNSFEEQIPVAEFLNSVKAMWICSFALN